MGAISLNKNKDIDITFRKGRAVVTPIFLCKYLRNANTTGKVAIKISSKKVKKAVWRNRIKRWIKESLKDASKKHGTTANMVLVLKCVPEEPLSYKSVYSHIKSILTQIS